MSGAIQGELFFFLVCVSTGVLLMFGYDLLRVLRRVFRHGSLLLAIEDFFYWSLAGIVAFTVIFLENSGAVRGFSLCAMLIGLALYHMSVSRFIVKYISAILRFISTILSKTVRFLLHPFMFFVKKYIKSIEKEQEKD